MRGYFLTDPGKVRTHNEDNVIISKNETNEILMAVADGMGGHKAGEIASSIAIDHLKSRFESLSSIGTKNDAISWLKDNVKEINNKIFKYTDENPESKGMGTTLVIAIMTNEFTIIGNVGDSSGYVMKENKLHKITHDHTLVNLLVTTGDLTEEEAKNHPRKNILMKALGANDPIDIDIFDIDNDIQSVLLCSDGLTNMLLDEQIEGVLNSDLDLESKIIKLILKCNNRGGTDNISVAYMIKESGE